MKLSATIRKDILILLRDKVGLSLMFAMPIILVLVVTLIQNNTFELLNKKNISLLVCNKDTGKLGSDLVAAIDKIGMFNVNAIQRTKDSSFIAKQMQYNNASLAIIIPQNFSAQVSEKAKSISGKALNSFGLEGDTSKPVLNNLSALTFYYKPEVQQQFKISIEGALNSALQTVQSREVLRTMYFSINEKALPDSMENEMLNDRLRITEVPLTHGSNKNMVNASQHNVPAWTIFAMFFIVMSLGGSIVREKQSGSFIRLKTMPTNFMIAILSKQITYLAVTFLQAFILFAIGLWVFPHIGLPSLNMPKDVLGLFIVTLVCGACAINYAVCIGLFAKTQEQANGFGAISIVILAIIGGLMIPSFAMPGSFKIVMQLSPLYWCLQSYYGLFLEDGKLKDVLVNILPLLGIIVILQILIFVRLKQKKLI